MTNIQQTLAELLEAYATNGHAKTKLYTNVAKRLSEVAGKKPAWKGDYIQAVSTGHLPASKKLARAVDALAAEFDGKPAIYADLEPVTIYVRPGTVLPDSILIGESIQCAWRTCPVTCIKTHYKQIYCKFHQDPKNRR
jgi:hypothetical protein